jgi:hypothetical protein
MQPLSFSARSATALPSRKHLRDLTNAAAMKPSRAKDKRVFGVAFRSQI